MSTFGAAAADCVLRAQAGRRLRRVPSRVSLRGRDERAEQPQVLRERRQPQRDTTPASRTFQPASACRAIAPVSSSRGSRSRGVVTCARERGSPAAGRLALP
jgi:hypothetical protein